MRITCVLAGALLLAAGCASGPADDDIIASERETLNAVRAYITRLETLAQASDDEALFRKLHEVRSNQTWLGLGRSRPRLSPSGLDVYHLLYTTGGRFVAPDWRAHARLRALASEHRRKSVRSCDERAREALNHTSIESILDGFGWPMGPVDEQGKSVNPVVWIVEQARREHEMLATLARVAADRSRSITVRLAAVDTLAVLRTTSAVVDTLRGGTSDPDAAIRAVCILWLGTASKGKAAGKVPLRREIVRASRDEVAVVRQAACAALRLSRDLGLPYLRQLLRDPSPTVRYQAADALARIKTAQSLSLLRFARTDPFAPVRARAAVAASIR